MPRIKIVDMENGNVFDNVIGYLTPRYDFSLPVVTVTDGDQTIKFTRDGAQTYSRDYGPLRINKLYPFLNYMEGYTSFNKWFSIGDKLQLQIQCAPNTVRVNQIKYNGQTVPYATSSHEYDILCMLTQTWAAGWKLAFANITINGDEEMIAIVAYVNDSDYLATTDYRWIFAFSKNAITKSGYEYPYRDVGDENKPGDPNEEGGYGEGLPDPEVTTSTDTSSWEVFPAGNGLHVYKAEYSDIEALSNFLWGKGTLAAFDPTGMWARWQNYKFNPIAAIISCHKIPSELRAPTQGPAVDLEMAGMTFDGSSVMGGVTINVNVIPNTIREITISPISIKRPYGSFADFSRTSVIVYVPFCGTLEIDPSLCVGGTIKGTILCDVINGNMCAQIITTNMYGKTQVAGNMMGNCAYKIPITGNDNGVGQMVGAIGAGGIGFIGSALSGKVVGALSSLAGGALGALTARSNTIVNGDCSGNAGYLATMTGFVQVKYGVAVNTTGDAITGSGTGQTGYNENIGRPSYLSGSVSEFSGYSELICHADSVTIATDAERAEIEEICRTGIIV